MFIFWTVDNVDPNLIELCADQGVPLEQCNSRDQATAYITKSQDSVLERRSGENVYMGGWVVNKPVGTDGMDPSLVEFCEENKVPMEHCTNKDQAVAYDMMRPTSE